MNIRTARLNRVVYCISGCREDGVVLCCLLRSGMRTAMSEVSIGQAATDSRAGEATGIKGSWSTEPWGNSEHGKRRGF